MFAQWKRPRIIAAIVAAAVLVITIVLLCVFLIPSSENTRYAIASNGHECAEIGKHIFELGGSAADAAIATLFCEGVSCPHSMGIGGGFLMTIYTKSTGKVETLNARETAPMAATADMFITSGESSVTGGLAVAVPGEVKGYYELHQKYGVLPWKDLVEPTINLCKNGHYVSESLASTLRSYSNSIKSIPSLREIFINPETNEVWLEGNYIKRPKLAETLEVIANEGSDAIYGVNGSLRKGLVDDIQAFGGILTEQDFLNYEVVWDDPVSTSFDGSNVYSVPLPGSGLLLTLILNILNGFLPEDIDPNSTILWQRVIESFKHAYAHRTHLGDSKFVPDIQAIVDDLKSRQYAEELRTFILDDFTSQDFAYYGANFTSEDDHGTAHVSVLAPNGDAVAITSTVNYSFGALIRSISTGIILNDLMDDFSTPGIDNAYGVPPSPANFIAPGKRPLSSMAPTIVVDKNGDVQLVIGAAGGPRITTGIAYVTLRHLWLQESLEDAMNAKRLHHQLAPMQVTYESGFNVNTIDTLASIGHVMTPVNAIASVTAIAIDEANQVTAFFDPRRGGSVAVVNDE